MRKQCRTFYLGIVGLVTLAVAPAIGQAQDIPRTPSGKPDLTETYDIATLTPLQRPQRLGDKAFFTEEEAAALERRAFEGNLARNQASDPNREAPPEVGTAPAALLAMSAATTRSGLTGARRPLESTVGTRRRSSQTR